MDLIKTLTDLGSLGILAWLLRWCLTEGKALLKEQADCLRDLLTEMQKTRQAVTILVAVAAPQLPIENLEKVEKFAEATFGVSVGDKSPVAAAGKTKDSGRRGRPSQSRKTAPATPAPKVFLAD